MTYVNYQQNWLYVVQMEFRRMNSNPADDSRISKINTINDKDHTNLYEEHLKY